MPNIPTFNPALDVNLGLMAQVSPGAMAAPGEALARGAEHLENVAAEFNARYQEARRGADAANIMAETTQKLSDAEFRWSKTADRQAALAGYNDEIVKLRKTMLGGINDSQLLSAVTREFDAEAAMRSVQVGNQAFKLESSKRTGDLRTNLQTFATAAASASDPVLRAKAIDDAHKAIAMWEQGAWGTPEEAAQERLGFDSMMDEVSVRHAKNAALGSQDPRQMQALEIKLNDPASFPGLLPHRREALLEQVTNAADRLESREAARQAHDDATAERNLHRAQSRNEAVILSGIYNGKTVDAAKLEGWALSGAISTDGLQAIHSAMNQAGEGRDDAITAAKLWHDIGTGQATVQDVYARAGSGISASTASQMVRAIDASPTGQKSTVKALYGVLKTAMNGQRIEMGQFGGASPAVKAWADAQGEWHRRITIDREDPTNVLNDMMRKYAHAQTPTWLATPKFGTIRSYEDYQRVGRATLQAVRSGAMDQATADVQGQLLKQYSLYYGTPRPRTDGGVAVGAPLSGKKP